MVKVHFSLFSFPSLIRGTFCKKIGVSSGWFWQKMRAKRQKSSIFLQVWQQKTRILTVTVQFFPLDVISHMPRLHLCYKSPVSSGYFFQEIHSKLWKSLVFALFTCNVLCSFKEDLVVIDSCWFPCRKLFSPPTKIITMNMLIIFLC